MRLITYMISQVRIKFFIGMPVGGQDEQYRVIWNPDFIHSLRV